MAVQLTDYRKIHKSVYQVKPGQIQILEIPDLQFLVLEGVTPRKRNAINLWAVYRLINQLRILTSRTIDFNFRHMPPEVLWQNQLENGDWSWTAMVQVPDQINDDLYLEGLINLRLKNKEVSYTDPILARINQGLCAHTLHIGLDNKTEETIEKIKQYVEVRGYRVSGTAREIYMNPMGMKGTGQLKTIIRVPLEILEPRH